MTHAESINDSILFSGLQPLIRDRWSHRGTVAYGTSTYKTASSTTRITRPRYASDVNPRSADAVQDLAQSSNTTALDAPHPMGVGGHGIGIFHADRPAMWSQLRDCGNTGHPE